MGEVVLVVLAPAVGVAVLVGLLLALRRPVRRFARARAGLREEVATGVAQLRALAYERGNRHWHGVDSP